MSDLQVFSNDMFGKIRALTIDGKLFVVGRDIAEMLEYAEPHKAVSAHCKGGITYPILTSGGTQETKVIPEGDIYRLIVKAADQSRNSEIKAKAEKIEKWIFDEVLPNIRKHGMYAKEELLDNPELLIDVITKLKQEKDEKKLLIAENQMLAQQNLIWADRKIIDALVKKYGHKVGYDIAWREFKKELLYARGINIELRITNYLNNTGRKTKPKTLDMIHNEEIPACVSSAVALCKNNNIKIDDIIKKYNVPR